MADGAIRVTDRHGGFVLSSSVSSGEGAEAGATLDLRIPSARLQPALADLSELAHVRSRTQEARDITAAFTSPRRRLSDALAERRGLLRQLARAVTRRTRPPRSGRGCGRSTAASTAPRPSCAGCVTASRSPPSRWRSSPAPATRATVAAGRSATPSTMPSASCARVLGGALVALAVLVPAGLLGGAGWLAYRGWVRRRRESALEM